MTNKIKELQEMCDFYHLDLRVQYYSTYEVCFKGVNDDEQEVFNVCAWYHNDKDRTFYIEIDSQNETWRGGQFTKQDLLLLISIDDLTDNELNIKPRDEVKNTKEISE